MWDQDGDRRIEQVEWLAITRPYFPDISEEDAESWAARDFANADRNGDGFIAVEDLESVMLEGFDCIDTDRDGKLTPDERSNTTYSSCYSEDAVKD